MKRIGISVIAVIFIAALLSSCATTGTGVRVQHYSYNAFRISLADFHSAPPLTDASFSGILTHVQMLMNYSVEDIPGTIMSEHELYEFLMQRGFTPENANMEISHLNSVGNNFFIFMFAHDDNYCVVMYLETIGDPSARVDRRLNGTWVGILEIEGVQFEVAYIFNNGRYESFSNGIASERGTYTTSGGEIFWNVTHLFGGSLNALLGGMQVLEPRWYTRDEFIAAVRPSLLNVGITEEQINEMLSPVISNPPSSYSVSRNSLTVATVFADREIVVAMSRR